MYRLLFYHVFEIEAKANSPHRLSDAKIARQQLVFGCVTTYMLAEVIICLRIPQYLKNGTPIIPGRPFSD